MSRPVVVDRPRSLLRVRGREPVKMVHGMATADLQAITPDQGAYTVFLTPKGRMVGDARVFLRTDGGETTLLLDMDPAAAVSLDPHFRKSVPPLFARFEDVTGEWAVVGVHGPGADTVARAAVATVEPDGSLPSEAPEARVVALPALGPGFAVRSPVDGSEGWDFVVPVEASARVHAALLEAGGDDTAGAAALERLRVLAGRPRWGAELTEDVIPLEAGLLDRAISQTKGCYTGQEVIVRILHRGHVNRHLRRLRRPDGPLDPGTELFEADGDRARGVVTSGVAADDGAVGLGYVRREVTPPAELRLGGPAGPVVRVEALD